MIHVYESNDKLVADIPVHWDCVPFVSTIPKNVTVGTRHARVFLRCSDDDVEFSRILSVPPGLQALIVSPREIEIWRAMEVISPIQDFVVVSTTWEKDKEIKIPVTCIETGFKEGQKQK